MGAAAPAIITSPTVTLTDRIRIQQQRIQSGDFVRIGKLTCVVCETQRSTVGASQNDALPGMFSKWQRKTWAAMTLDWLTHTNAPILAISRDRHDLLIPFRLPALPDIPDPRWNGNKIAPAADSKIDTVPRIPQVLAGCPVVGDRVCGTIKDRVSGKTYAIFRPITELQVMCGGGKESGFGRIKCGTDPADRTVAALLINIEPARDGSMEAYFVGGSFHAG
jgi:hypothetical protein